MSEKLFCKNCKTSKEFIANATITKEVSINESGKILEENLKLDQKINYVYECKNCGNQNIIKIKEQKYRRLNFIQECIKEAK